MLVKKQKKYIVAYLNVVLVENLFMKILIVMKNSLKERDNF
jgi:hypothetical protein